MPFSDNPDVEKLANEVAVLAAKSRTQDILLLLRQFKNTAYQKAWQPRDIDVIAITLDAIIALVKETYKVDNG